jgi:hypothetical protein
MADIQFPYTPRPWAKPLHQLMSSTSFRALVAVVHRRAGKSWMGAAAICLAALTVPGRYGIIGPQLKTMKAIFWPLLKTYLAGIVPADNFRVGDLTITVPCVGGGESIISIHSAGDADQGSNIRGLQFQGLLVDEADQIGAEAFWGEIWPTQANLTNPWIIITGTPRGDQLLADLLRQADRTPGWHGVALSVYDTGVIHPDEIATTKAMMPPDQFAREMEARTDVGTADQLIKIENILAALRRPVSEHERRENAEVHPLVLGIDIGRLNDATVMCLRQGPIVHEFVELREATTQQIAITALNIARERQVDAVFVDAGSMGISVIDVMIQLGLNPIGINFGGTAIDAERFSNRRAEMFDAVRAWSEKPNASLPDQKGDTRLQKELTAPTFKLNASNKLQIEAKADIKKRLGHSTDSLDALALTFAASVATPGLYDGALRNKAEQSRADEDARVQRAADGSTYTSSRRTGIARGDAKTEEFDPHEAEHDAFDPYDDSPDTHDHTPRGIPAW